MKTKPSKKAFSIALTLFALTACASFHAAAQTVQYLTLTCTNLNGGANTANFAVQTNQIIQLVGGSPGGFPTIQGYFPNGMYTIIAGGPAGQPLDNLTIWTGMTNIAVSLGQTANSDPLFCSAAAFKITTPASAVVVSNYVPADAIVVPASATGSVQIILESSPDLVNWTAANPGTYSAASATNRFFRVRAVVN